MYDGEHYGEHVGVVACFQNEKTEYTAGGTLRAACWLSGAASPVAYSRRLPRPSAVRVAGWEDREGVTHYVIEVKEPGSASVKDVEAPTRRLHKRFNDFRGLPL